MCNRWHVLGFLPGSGAHIQALFGNVDQGWPGPLSIPQVQQLKIEVHFPQIEIQWICISIALITFISMYSQHSMHTSYIYDI